MGTDGKAKKEFEIKMFVWEPELFPKNSHRPIKIYKNPQFQFHSVALNFVFKETAEHS